MTYRERAARSCEEWDRKREYRLGWGLLSVVIGTAFAFPIIGIIS